MDKESFNYLLELQSCEKKINDLQEKIKEEENRISFLRKTDKKTSTRSMKRKSY